MESYRDVSRAAAKRQPEMLKMIAELVGIESPTEDRAGVNRCVALVERWMRASGGSASAPGNDRPGIFWWAASGRPGAPLNH